MELKDLRYFCLAAELGSITRAAETLGVSQPFVTKVINRLEEELGCKTTVIATGGIAQFIVPLCRREMRYEKNLILKGLAHIYRENTR